MTPAILGLLFGAGVVGGCANAIAGGATLITFPAMLATGLPPVSANASNSVAVTPGALVAALSDRAKWPPFDRRLALQLVMAVLGGAFGGWLLISTTDRTFTKLVPALIGGATVLFACAPRIQAYAARHQGGARHAAGAGLIGAAAVYGGYFGAGLGVMLMAILSITGGRELRAVNANKNMLSVMVSLPTIVLFIAEGLVNWPATATMLAGAMTGGFLGARLMRIIPAKTMRGAIVAIGAAMTAIYAVRDWL